MPGRFKTRHGRDSHNDDYHHRDPEAFGNAEHLPS